MRVAVDDDTDLVRLRHDVLDRFDAQPFNSWPEPLLRTILGAFDLAGISPLPKLPEPGVRVNLRLVR